MMKFAVLPVLTAALLAAATPAHAAQITAVTSANIVKPVSLTKLQDMDFGTLLVENYAGTRTVTISRAGVVTCAADIACSGAPRQARFNVQGTNRLVVLISVASTGLVNGSDSIAFAPDAPSSVTLTSSGVPGNNFDVGGSLTVSGSIPAGLYSGTMTVTANYQ
jgi:hypothetical protein